MARLISRSVGLALRVGGGAGVDEEQCVGECLVDVGDLVCGGSLPAFDLGLFGLDALLLGLENLFGDALLVVEVDELLLLVGEFS